MSFKFINKVQSYYISNDFEKTCANFILSESQLFDILEVK